MNNNNDDEDVYKYINEITEATEPGVQGLLYFPYLIGERNLGIPESRSVFFGINANHNKGSFIRSIMGGISFEHKRVLEIMDKVNCNIKSINLTGGGSKSRIWNQIRADIYQKPVYTINTTECGIVGATLLAALGAGIYENEASAIKKCIRIKEKYNPNPKLKERYNYLFEVYKEFMIFFKRTSRNYHIYCKVLFLMK